MPRADFQSSSPTLNYFPLPTSISHIFIMSPRSLSFLNISSLLLLARLISAFSYTVAFCEPFGDVQSLNFININAGIADWFQYSDTGPTCAQDEDFETDCRARSTVSSDVCQLDGAYVVWDTARMNCGAYNQLRDKALSVCGSGGAGNGYADCACGVYLQSDCGSCLLATYSYHAEGTAVFAPVGGPSEPETPGFNYSGHTEFRRDGDEGEEEEAVQKRDGLEKRQNYYPYPESFNAQGAPSVWGLDYLGDCSATC